MTGDDTAETTPGGSPGASRPARPSLVFIAGLGHSGSTLLSLLLSGQDEVVGLGEVHNHLRFTPADRAWRLPRPCTCGAPMGDCELWGPINELCEDPTVPVEEKYRVVVERTRALYGPDVTIVDSSKNLESLRLAMSVTDDVSVVHLVRDVRSWTISNLDRWTRRRERTLRQLVARNGPRGVSRRLKTTAWSRFSVWDAQNGRFVRELPLLGLPVTRIGYEPLATSPQWVLERLCTHLGLAFDDTMLAPSALPSHEVGGNLMRISPSKTRAVTYSTRWLRRREWLVPSLLRPRIMAHNTEWVYGATGLAPVDRYDDQGTVAPR